MSTDNQKTEPVPVQRWLDGKIRSGALLEYPTYVAEGSALGQRPEKYARRLAVRLETASHETVSYDEARRDAEMFRDWILAQPRPRHGLAGLGSAQGAARHRTVKGSMQLGGALREIAKRVPAREMPADSPVYPALRWVPRPRKSKRSTDPAPHEVAAACVVFFVLPTVLLSAIRDTMQGQTAHACAVLFCAGMVVMFVASMIVTIMTRPARQFAARSSAPGQAPWRRNAGRITYARDRTQDARPITTQSVFFSRASRVPPATVSWSIVGSFYVILFLGYHAFLVRRVEIAASVAFFVSTCGLAAAVLMAVSQVKPQTKLRVRPTRAGVFDSELDG